MDGKQGWFVVLGAFLTLTVTSGIAFFALPVMIEPIGAAMGWSLTQISLGVTIWGFSAALCSPFIGTFIDRHGARASMLLGTMLLCICTGLLGRVSSLGQFYAVMALAAIGGMASTYIPVAAVVARWFVHKRGVATGVALLGLGAGGAIAPLLSAALLETRDWRGVFAILAVLVLTALVPILVLVRNPARAMEEAYAAAVEGGIDTGHDMPLRAALRTRSFWGLSLADMLTGLIFAVFNVHLIYYLTSDLGDAATATQVYSALQLCIAFGILLFGALADRFPLRPLVVVCYLMPALAVLLLLPGKLTLLAFAFALAGGLAGGGRSALFPVTLVHCFGETHVGAIYGVSNSLFMIGNALGPFLGGMLYDQTGSTRAVFAACAVTLTCSALLVSLIRSERTQGTAVH